METVKLDLDEAKHLLADSASIKDLIHRDISRCNDNRCPTAPVCERYLQIGIDYKKGVTLVSVTNFKGCEKVGLCDHFLNVDVVEYEINRLTEKD